MSVDSGPADTTMMRIVHDALRRDLRRSRATLLRTPPPDRRQRAAVTRHLTWMIGFLEAHHRSEDRGLYPLVRDRDTGASRLLDEMGRDHEVVAVAAEAVVAAASVYHRNGEAGILVSALDRLTDVMLPHLEREEVELMPMVSRALTQDEWNAIEQRFNLDGKSVAQLGREGHWLIDDATAADRARVLQLVPPVARFVLLHGFGAPYRRRTRAWWTPRRRVQHQGAVSVVVDAGIEAVWEVVRNPTRVGEWSHECVDGAWVGAATEPVPGARFRGRNRHGVIRWGRLCEIVDATPYTLVWRVVPTRFYPDSTVWTLRLRRGEGGTVIEQTFEVVKGSWLEPLYAILVPSHRERTDALTCDLQRIGELARPSVPARSRDRPHVADRGHDAREGDR